SKTFSQTRFNYDNNANNDDMPNQGRLTLKTDWLNVGTTPDPQTKYSYDSYGNLISTADPNGNITTITYDSDSYMFPLKTTNALNQNSSSIYYGVAGAPQDAGLWGQLKSTTDANNQTASFTYDAFGRPLTTVSPLDSVSFPTTQKS